MKTKLFLLAALTPLLMIGQGTQIDLPIDWEGSTVDYTVTDFGGNSSQVVADPTNASNSVLESVKSASAQTWAGTTLGTSAGLATAIPFASGSTIIQVAVYSPDSGIAVRLKAEDHTDPTISVETEAMTTVANAWDTLSFDFSNEAAGTAAINFNNTYDMLSIFYNFGVDGATAGAKTYYCDIVQFGVGAPVLNQIDLPIDWEGNTTDYTVTDFGGNTSVVVTDPTDPNNTVLESEKTASAQTWAGTTLGTPAGLATAIPFAAGSTEITVRVWSPDANTPILLKVEDATDANISVETQMMTTVASAWDTITFDFTNNVSGTPAIDFSKTYDKISIFYNFGTDGATAGAKTYYCDEVVFGTISASLNQIDLPIDWEGSTTDYTVTDFGGNASMVVADPTDTTNTVLESTKTASAQTWAGTTLGTPAGLANAIPFSAGNTEISVRVWSPDANTPVLLKVEDAADGNISVETEVMTTVAGAWDTLVFDFTNNASGTPAIDFTQTYDKISIFYNFGTDGATAGAKTYYCDDIMFLGTVGLEEELLSDFSIAPNPSQGLFTVSGNFAQAQNAELYIVNVQGQVLHQQSLNGVQFKEVLDLNLTNGVYFVQVVSEGVSETRRLLIQN